MIIFPSSILQKVTGTSVDFNKILHHKIMRNDENSYLEQNKSETYTQLSKKNVSEECRIYRRYDTKREIHTFFYFFLILVVHRYVAQWDQKIHKRGSKYRFCLFYSFQNKKFFYGNYVLHNYVNSQNTQLCGREQGSVTQTGKNIVTFQYFFFIILLLLGRQRHTGKTSYRLEATILSSK